MNRKKMLYLAESGLGLAQIWENGKVRIQRFSNCFRVWDLENTGKRGKKVRVLSVMPKNTGEAEWLEDQSELILLRAATYDSVKKFYKNMSNARVSETAEREINVAATKERIIQ